MMHKRLTYRAVTSALALLAISCLVRGSEVVLAGKTNVTVEQYDAALMKWNNLHVTEYEVTARYMNWGTWNEWKAVVHIDRRAGNVAERMTHFENLGHYQPTPISQEDLPHDPTVKQN